MWSPGTKSGDLARDARLERGRIEPRDAADRRGPPAESLPQPLDTQPDRRDRADARDDHPPRVAHDAVSTARRMPARVRDAIPCMNTGPITQAAARLPMRGQRGPVQSCTIVTSVSSPSGLHLPDHVHARRYSPHVAVVHRRRRAIHPHLRHPPGGIPHRAERAPGGHLHDVAVAAALELPHPAVVRQQLGPALDVHRGFEHPRHGRPHPGAIHRPHQPAAGRQVATSRYPGRRSTVPLTPAAARSARSSAAE